MQSCKKKVFLLFFFTQTDCASQSILRMRSCGGSCNRFSYGNIINNKIHDFCWQISQFHQHLFMHAFGLFWLRFDMYRFSFVRSTSSSVRIWTWTLPKEKSIDTKTDHITITSHLLGMNNKKWSHLWKLNRQLFISPWILQAHNFNSEIDIDRSFYWRHTILCERFSNCHCSIKMPHTTRPRIHTVEQEEKSALKANCFLNDAFQAVISFTSFVTFCSIKIHPIYLFIYFFFVRFVCLFVNYRSKWSRSLHLNGHLCTILNLPLPLKLIRIHIIVRTPWHMVVHSVQYIKCLQTH